MVAGSAFASPDAGSAANPAGFRGAASTGRDLARCGEDGGRSYAQLRQDYRAVLARGGQATSAYVAPETPAAHHTAAQQASDIREFESALWALRQALHHPLWTEQALDTLSVPHPLLGLISLRELLFFTVYHNIHHLTGVQSQLEQA